jgi:hypothetical protein
MKNDKPVRFLVFVFFKFSQIFKKKLSRPVFDELTKPVRNDLVGFHKNRTVFIDIVIHVLSITYNRHQSAKDGIDSKELVLSITCCCEWMTI